MRRRGVWQPAEKLRTWTWTFEEEKMLSERQQNAKLIRRCRRRAALWQAMVMPGIAMLLLGGVWVQGLNYRTAPDYAAYHARCRAAVASMPTQVGHWIGSEVALPLPAMQLLDPNALRNIRFVDFSPEGLEGPDRRVSLMIVQCRLAKDMLGHYPPECYPARGATLIEPAQPRQWTIGEGADALTVEGMEYHFAEPDPTRAEQRRLSGTVPRPVSGRRRVVLNFMIVPGYGIARDMKEVERSAEDYQQRHRGAAQVQLVFDPAADLPDRLERDRIFRELLTPALPALRALMDLDPSQELETPTARSTPEPSDQSLAGLGDDKPPVPHEIWRSRR